MEAAARDRLRALPLFARLTDDALAHLADASTEFEVPAGRVLVEIGQPGAGLFVLQEGRAVVDLPHGGEVELGPGEFFGEMSLLTDDPHSARVRAKTELRGLAIARRDFTTLLAAHPQVAVAMLPVLARRLRDVI